MPHTIKIEISADDLAGGRDTALALREFFLARGWDYQVRDGGPKVFGMARGAAIVATVDTKYTQDALDRAGAFQVTMKDGAPPAPPPSAMDLVLESPAYPETRGELGEFLAGAMTAVARDHATGGGSGDGDMADAVLIGLNAIVALDPSRRPLLERFLADALAEGREFGGADEIAKDQDDGDGSDDDGGYDPDMDPEDRASGC